MDNVLLVSGSEKESKIITQLLKESGYKTVLCTERGSSARRLIKDNNYDLIVVNTPLGDEFGHELSIMASEASNAGIILVCKADIAEDITEKVGYYGVCVVIKPLNKSDFIQSVTLVTATRQRMLGLRRGNSRLQTKSEEIRLVNRAKRVLMQYLNMTEPQAHRYIEKQAMDTRQTKMEVAKRILTTYET
jgi:response regulator NasT